MAITTNGKVSITNLQVGSSADLASIISDESGTGVLAFTNSPSFTTPALGTPSAVTLTNGTGLPVSGITASTSAALGVGTIELGHATDTTIARGSAGVVTIEGVNVVTTSSTDTLTNKTINLTSNTLSGTTAQFNTALSDGDFATLAGSETLTNKTLTTPVISTISNTGTLTLPTTTGTLALTSDITVTPSSTTTLTNKTISLGSNTISGTTAQFNTALSDDDFATLAGTETLTNKTLTAPVVNLSLNAQTGTTYTFVLSDNGKLVTASNASAQTYTIPPNSSVAYATGAQINIIQIGAGQVTIQGGSGVTVASTGATATTPKLRAQYSTATCIKGGSDTWYVVGDIS